MAFEYLTNVPLEEARATYLAALRQAGLSYKTETIPTSTALGRVTANAVYARISSPHYNACAMDGIALDAKQTFGASETTPARSTPRSSCNRRGLWNRSRSPFC